VPQAPPDKTFSVLEEQITIVESRHDPRAQTGEAGARFQ